MHYAIWVCMHKSLCTKSVTASGHALRRFMHYNWMHYENFDCSHLAIGLILESEVTVIVDQYQCVKAVSITKV